MSLYPRLFENPNAINLTGKVEEWIESKTIPFSYYHKEMYVGSIGTTHDDMQPRNYKKDGRGEYSGRLYVDHYVITFWHFPENKEILKKVLKDLQDTINKDKYDEFNNLHIDFSNKKWKVEIPTKNFEKLKKYPTKPIYKNTRLIFPDWGNWDPNKKDHKYISIEDYNQGYERTKSELAIRHLIPPGAGKKEVPYGFGSRNPEYMKKRQWQMATVGDESKKELKYPRLFENPDSIYNENLDQIARYDESDDDPMPFLFYKNKAYVISGGTHGSLLNKFRLKYPSYDEDDEGDSIRNLYQYAGRLWKKLKLISFWVYPPVEKFKEIIDKLSNSIGENIYSSEWKIEVVTDQDKTEIIKPGNNDWSNSVPTKLIPVPEYDGSKERSKEELQIRHLIPPGAGKKPVPMGFGSRNPKYQIKRQWQMATLGDESKQEDFYPKLNEYRISKAKQKWINLYVKSIGSTDYVSPKIFETLRANFGPNDETAENRINTFLQNHAKIAPDTYKIEVVHKGTFDNDVKNYISGEFEAYKAIFIKPTTDIFNNNYNIGESLIITNRMKTSAKTGEIGIIGKKDLTPNKMKLNLNTYSDPIKLLEKVKSYIYTTQYPENYKKFILNSSEEIIKNKSNMNKFKDFEEYNKVSTPIIYNIPTSLFKGIDQISINNIQNDYGEVLGALMFFNILKNAGKGLRYPSISNQKLIDFYFDDYKISSKGKIGGTPSGDTIIKLINDAYENKEIFFDKNDIDFYNNVINPWVNPEKLDKKSNIYNVVMTLAKLHLGIDKNSGYSYLLSNMNIFNKSPNRDAILLFMDKLVNDNDKFNTFMLKFIRKTKFFAVKFNIENYKKDYIQKRDAGNNDRLGLIFYPIVVELVKSLNENYADILTAYTQKATDIKQVYLNVSVKSGLFIFKTQSFTSSSFIFEQKGSINNPFNANIGIKMKQK